MALPPNQDRPRGKRSGTGSGEDPTLEPGNYDNSSIFGGPLPEGTGAPGSRGGAGGGTGAPGDTTQAGQLTDGLTGVTDADITQSGAPGTGTSPASPGGTSISYTLAGSEQAGTYQTGTASEAVGGTGDSTLANGEGYGTGGPQLPGIKGNEPTSTGAGRGNTMRGGRAVR